MNAFSLKKITELPWESRFASHFPGDSEVANFARQVQKVAYSEVKPTAVSHPKLIGWSESLASDLGISRPLPEELISIDILSGNQILSGMRPYASRYGGHQFGQWAGQLGDGRAITLGESLLTGGRFEFQLKGAGPTPYSRRADGRAVLRSSLREFLCSEAMHFLGVPTTRALSLVLTGDPVVRDLFYDGNPKAEPGAIVCRVSPSFLRFGHFQILAAQGEIDLLKSMADFLITDHYPHIELTDPDTYGKLLDEISRGTAEMIAHWMRVGFVHGVMNTDNMSALGLTIDYGPYGWLESYDPQWTPNTTDAQGRRYRYGNQPDIALWNLMRLCEALYPLIQDEARLHQSLDLYKETFDKSHTQMLSQKIGLSEVKSTENKNLANDLFQLLELTETDFTIFFRTLCDWKVQDSSVEKHRGEEFLKHIAPSFYSPESLSANMRDQWASWSQRYTEQIRREGAPDEERSRSMKKANPKYVLRNYLAQNAITAAEKGDFSLMERLLRVLQTPYDEQPAEIDLAAKRPEWARNAPGCSALSCSS